VRRVSIFFCVALAGCGVVACEAIFGIRDIPYEPSADAAINEAGSVSVGTTVASDQAEPREIAADESGHVYWLNHNAGVAGSLMELPSDAGPAFPLSEKLDDLAYLSLAGPSIYFKASRRSSQGGPVDGPWLTHVDALDGGFVFSYPKSAHVYSGLAATEDGHLFFCFSDGALAGYPTGGAQLDRGLHDVNARNGLVFVIDPVEAGVRSYAYGTGALIEGAGVLHGYGSARALAIDDFNIYAVSEDRVVSQSLSSGAPRVLAIGLNAPVALTVRGSKLYVVTAQDGNLYALSLAPPGPAVLRGTGLRVYVTSTADGRVVRFDL
jgi:hypothetical protein